jgi:hypothetical protein
VSRAKKARARERRVAERPPTAAPARRPGETTATRESRLAAPRRRARLAKTALGAGGAVVFGTAMLLARVSYGGHPKRPPQPLGAPPHFVDVVRRNLLEAGIVAPAQAPPDAATSVS